MKKSFIRILSLVFCLVFLFGSSCVFANEINLSQKCSLTLKYTKENKIFSDLEIKIYRIATFTDDLEFKADAPFDSYPVRINGVTSQTEWNEVASTLRGYIEADGIIPYRVQKTDADGNVEFNDLDTGLYLIGGLSVNADGTNYTFYDSMMVLPSKDGDSYVYDVTAKPKSTQSEPSTQEKTYTVLKLWQDEGHTDKRPASVTVDIVKNGQLEETVTLSSANNWTYSFTLSDPNASISVVERKVAKDYTVKVTEKDSSFIIINTWNTQQTDEPVDPPTTPPQTGDTSSLGLWMLLLCISGLSLIVLGVLWNKEKA